MKLKKIISCFAISIMLVTVLNGCGRSEGDSISGKSVVKVGCKNDVPNFGLMNIDTREFEGFEIDVAKAICKEVYGENVEVKFEAVTAKTRGPLVETGELDMVAATFTITEDRKETYNFTQPYYTDHVKLMVQKTSGIKDFADLDGKIIGVSQSATTKQSLQKAADEIGISLEFSEFASYPEIKAALDSGRVDCFSVDGSILSGYLNDSLMLLPDEFSPQEYGIAIAKRNTDLAKRVDEAIGKMKGNGELDKLIEKWGLN
ncbi:MAG TPA: transporter substrate-binding domain-containing protein [Candidatus Merdenecus merdavium]|nr:transporter substrate-binding domain-containing protein [Candidatus Merdenecus merdavium]